MVYALLALFATALMLIILLEGSAFAGFGSIVVFVASVLTFVVCSVATWLKWNDNSVYNYETPYKTSSVTRVIKIIFGSYTIAMGIFIVFVVLGGMIFGFKPIDNLISNYSGLFLVLTSLICAPLVRKYMK